MSTDTAPPPADDAKRAAFTELQRRAGTDATKLAALHELGRRYGIAESAPAAPGPTRADGERFIGKDGQEYVQTKFGVTPRLRFPGEGQGFAPMEPEKFGTFGQRVAGNWHRVMDEPLRETGAALEETGQRASDLLTGQVPAVEGARDLAGAAGKYVAKGAGVAFAPIAAAITDAVGDPMHEQRATGIDRVGQVARGVMRTAADVVPGATNEAAHLPGVRQSLEFVGGKDAPDTVAALLPFAAGEMMRVPEIVERGGRALVDRVHPSMGAADLGALRDRGAVAVPRDAGGQPLGPSLDPRGVARLGGDPATFRAPVDRGPLDTPQNVAPGARVSARGNVYLTRPGAPTVGTRAPETFVEPTAPGPTSIDLRGDVRSRPGASASEDLRGTDRTPTQAGPGLRQSGQDTRGLEARVQKAGFRSLQDAADAVRRGDETALEMLKPKDVDALVEITDRAETQPGRFPSRVVEQRKGPRPTRGPDATGSAGTTLRAAAEFPEIQSGPPEPTPMDLYLRLPADEGTPLRAAEEAPSGPTTLRAATAPATAPGFFATQFNEKIGNLRHYSDELHDSVKQTLSLRATRTAKDVRDLEVNLGRMTPEDRAALSPAIMEGRAQGTPAQRAFVAWWRTKHPEVRNYLTSVGSRVVEKLGAEDLPTNVPSDWNVKETGPSKYTVTRPIGEMANFFPMRLSEAARDAIKAGDSAVTERVYGAGIEQGAWKDRAGFEDYLDTYEAPGLKSTNPGVERPRKFVAPDDLREPDVPKTLHQYLVRAHQTGAEQDVYNYFDKATGEARNPDAVWGPQGDLGDMIGRLEPSERPAATKLVVDLLGRDPESWSGVNRGAIRTSNVVGVVNALRLYGLRPTTALVQLTQNAMTNALVGEIATAKAVGRLMKSPREVYETAVRSGAVRPHAQYAETIGVREGAPLRSAAGRALQKVGDVALAPMSLTDMASRLVASATAEDLASQMSGQLNGNKWSRRIAEVKLRQLDYAPSDVAAFKAGRLTPEQMDVLRQRIVERTQGEVTNASRLPFATTPIGRVLMQGKNFGVAQARNSWRVAGVQLFQAGNPVPAARLVLGSWLVGKGIVAGKDALVGPASSRPGDFASDIQQGGFYGMLGDLAESAHQGKAQLQSALDRLTDAQFTGLVESIAKATYDVVSPPTERRIPIREVGVTLSAKKSRTDVLLSALRDAAPTAKEWYRIYDHFVGDDAIRQKEAGAKAMREAGRAAHPELEIAR